MRRRASLTLLVGGIIVLASFSGCDTDRFLGYKYEAEPLANFVHIEGRIVNAFNTREAVDSAVVNLEGQAAVSNRSGDYVLDYVLTGDEIRDRPIRVLISQRKYYTLDTTLVIRGDIAAAGWQMTYAAPRALSSSFADSTVFARMFDYQGEATIDSVVCWAPYLDGGRRRQFDAPFRMTKIQTIDANTADYVVLLPSIASRGEFTGALTLGIRRYSIRAYDSEGYKDTIFFFPGGKR